MNDCIFCKIVKKEIPCYLVYEDPKYLAFLDINPLNPGHVMVIPKKHVRWVWDVDDFGKYFEVVKKIARGQEKALKPEWISLAVVGLGVPHAHVHIVPRFSGDGHGEYLDPKNIKKISEKEMNSMADKIKKAINQKGE